MAWDRLLCATDEASGVVLWAWREQGEPSQG